MLKKQLVLVIMDGVGLAASSDSNAVACARMDTLKNLARQHLSLSLGASGSYVGLKAGQMGNSEVGHNTMGAGEIIPQIASLVDDAFASGDVFKSQAWCKSLSIVKDNNSTLHFIGIFSDGGVHSNIAHLEAMLKQAQLSGVKKVRLHILLDGRDVAPCSEPKYIRRIESFIKQLGASDYLIASGGGRMTITADRYGDNWGMVERGWRTHVLGEARAFPSAEIAVQTFRREQPGIQDQNLPPFVVAKNGEAIGKIKDGDSVIYYDFRSDRALEITEAFTQPIFTHFNRPYLPKINFTGMTTYDLDRQIPHNILVAPAKIPQPLPEYLSQKGLRQFAISETVKFGHIGYYFNGNRRSVPKGEIRRELLSCQLPFELCPWMQSAESTTQLVRAIESQKYDFLRINFPGGDMLGHTGNMQASIVALEAIDIAIRRIIASAKKHHASVIICADHGNAEELRNRDGMKTSHTTNPVPCIVADFSEKAQALALKPGDYGLANLAASIAFLLDIEPSPRWLPSFLESAAPAP